MAGAMPGWGAGRSGRWTRVEGPAWSLCRVVWAANSRIVFHRALSVAGCRSTTVACPHFPAAQTQSTAHHMLRMSSKKLATTQNAFLQTVGSALHRQARCFWCPALQRVSSWHGRGCRRAASRARGCSALASRNFGSRVRSWPGRQGTRRVRARGAEAVQPSRGGSRALHSKWCWTGPQDVHSRAQPGALEAKQQGTLKGDLAEAKQQAL